VRGASPQTLETSSPDSFLRRRPRLPKGLEIGLVGYYYDQVTDDRGPATAFLGGFQGRVFGYGPFLGWLFKLGEKQAGISARWYHETGARNRLEGDTGIVSFTLEL
jgi:hypothetical protein